jgi:PhnB protein
MFNPDEGFPRVVPELVYQDVISALDWLSKVFGFREILRHPLGDGKVGHAQMDTGSGGLVMLTNAAGELRSPAGDAHVCTKVIVFVDDVDRHFAAVEEAGVETLHKPTDKPWGLRQYLVKDHEGHMWEFSQHVEDVPSQEWGAEIRQPLSLPPARAAQSDCCRSVRNPFAGGKVLGCRLHDIFSMTPFLEGRLWATGPR